MLRRAILGRYYEALFEGDLPRRYVGATWDEYLALVQRRLPTASPRWAAEEASRNGRGDLGRYIDRFPQERPWTDRTGLDYLASRYATVRENRKPGVDLGRSIGHRDVRVIDLQRANISGWRALRSRNLKYMELRLCKTDEATGIEPRCRIDLLSLSLSSRSCATVMCEGSRARRLIVLHKGVFDLHSLERQDRLLDLGVSADSVIGARHLRSRLLSRLRLGHLTLDDDVLETVAVHKATLTHLDLDTTIPFAPSDLPRLPALQQLTVPAFEVHRSAWLRFAISFNGHVTFNR